MRDGARGTVGLLCLSRITVALMAGIPLSGGLGTEAVAQQGKEPKMVSESEQDGKEPMSRSPMGQRDALHEATRRGDAATVQYLLETQGVDPDRVDALGRTALHYAAANGYGEVVEALLGSGAQVNLVDADGFSPLHRAIQGGHVAVVQLLIRNGADLGKQTQSGEFPIDIATKNKDLKMIELLQGGEGRQE